MKISIFVLMVLAAVALNEVGAAKLNVVYAVNAGGDRFQDSDGITYQKDPATQGVESDFGRRLDIERVNPHDAALYQTERYATSSFGYDIPIKEDGSYVLVVKFAEVYFRNPGQKVFDVSLNSHLIIEELDIFATVGFATAHDELIPFRVSGKGKKLTVGEHTSDITGGKVRLEFMKGYSDNPKVNAFYVIKGSLQDVPLLEPISWEGPPEGEEDEIDEGDMMYGDDEEDIHFRPSDLGHDADLGHGSINNIGGGRRTLRKVNVRSGIPAEDPWDKESAFVIYLPLVGSVGASVVSFLVVRFFVSGQY